MPRPDARARLISTLESRLLHSYRRLGLLGRRVLLAVSGGADSTALLRASAAVAGPAGLHLEVACVNHGLREGAAREQSAVESLCLRLNIRAHLPTVVLAGGAGVEDRARRARYDALEEVRRTAGVDWVATAHTASDQAETLLMRLVRGTALRGAAGVRELRPPVVRPMLDWIRADVLEYLQALEQPFFTDAMNADTRFLRVRIRERALPVLEAAAQTPVAHKLAHFARLAADDDALLSEWAEAALARLRLGPEALDATGVRALAPSLQRRVIARFLEGQGVEVGFASLEAALLLLRGGPDLPLPRDGTLRVRGGRLLVSPNPPRRRRSPAS